MKRLLILILSIMVLSGISQVKLPSAIIPNDSTDSYSLMFTEHISGSLKHVVTYAGLDSISEERLVLGTFATVADSGYALYYVSSMSPVTWTYYEPGNPVLANITVSDTTRWGDVSVSDLTFDGTRTITNPNLSDYGTSPGGTSVTEFLDNYFYPDEDPGASLSVSGSSVLEYGLSGASLNRTLNWTATKTTNDIATIVVAGISKTATGSTQSGTQSVTITANVTNTYTMTVTDTEGLQDTDNAIWYFRHGYYWGSMASVASISDADIRALDGAGVGSGKELTTTRVKSFDGINAAGDYLVFAFPSSWGAPTFKVNGLTSTAFTKVRDNTFVNVNGYSETYQVWVSDTQQNNPITNFDIE